MRTTGISGWMAIAVFLIFFGFSAANASCIFARPIEARDLEVGNLLSWSTAREIDNQLFVVQRSLDGVMYTTIGQVKGAGNSDEMQHYRYLDISIGEARVFYRIKQIDSEGKAANTHTVLLNRLIQNNFVITAMSSTDTDRFFTLTLYSNIEKKAKYRIVDKSSRLVREGATEITAGPNMLSLDLEGLQNGRYRCIINIGEEIETVYVNKVESGRMPKVNYVIKQ